jgi:hypothetical protein
VTGRIRPALRALEVLSILELASIGILLLNLVTLHLRPVTAAMGPVHGALYLAVVVTALLARGLLARTRWMALIPVAGGVLTLVNVRIERRRTSASP